MSALRRAPRDPHERIAELMEEVAYLRHELGLDLDADRLDRIMCAFNVTAGMARILLILHARRGRVARTHFIVEAMGTDAMTKIVDVFVCKARKAIGAAAIRTVWGHGYALTPLGLALMDAALAGDSFISFGRGRFDDGRFAQTAEAA